MRFSVPLFPDGWYVLAFEADLAYRGGIPPDFNLGVWKMPVNPREKLPEDQRLFLGNGETFENWSPIFEYDDAELPVAIPIPVFVRIRHAGVAPFESIGQLTPGGIILGDKEQLYKLTPAQTSKRVALLKRVHKSLDKLYEDLEDE